MKTLRNYFKIVEIGRVAENDLLQSGLPRIKEFIVAPVRYLELEVRHIGRLDLLSQEAYETPFLWWVIAIVNDLIDPFDSSKVNTLISIPSLEDIYNFYDTYYEDQSQFNKYPLEVTVS